MKNSDFLVYILDDSEIITEIMKRVISSMPGVTVATFRDSASFIEKFSDKTPQLVFLDFYLDCNDKNELNGEQLFLAIKQKNPKLPIVLLTGINDKDKLAYFKTLGFSEVINKSEPEIFNRILNTVKSFNS